MFKAHKTGSAGVARVNADVERVGAARVMEFAKLVLPLIAAIMASFAVTHFYYNDLTTLLVLMILVLVGAIAVPALRR
jgi:hypothetical protein